MLVKSLADIEQVESQTNGIKNTYKENLEELSSVSTHQAVILDELQTIEAELDRMLPQAGSSNATISSFDGLKKNKYLTTFLRDPDLYKSDASREKVFGQALDLERSIAELKEDVKDVNTQMMNTDQAHTKAADLYLYKSDESKVQQVNDMEMALANFYSSLKWIENASVDLKFQVEDIQNKVDARAGGNNFQIYQTPY